MVAFLKFCDCEKFHKLLSSMSVVMNDDRVMMCVYTTLQLLNIYTRLKLHDQLIRLVCVCVCVCVQFVCCSESHVCDGNLHHVRSPVLRTCRNLVAVATATTQSSVARQSRRISAEISLSTRHLWVSCLPRSLLLLMLSCSARPAVGQTESSAVMCRSVHLFQFVPFTRWMHGMLHPEFAAWYLVSYHLLQRAVNDCLIFILASVCSILSTCILILTHQMAPASTVIILNTMS